MRRAPLGFLLSCLMFALVAASTEPALAGEARGPSVMPANSAGPGAPAVDLRARWTDAVPQPSQAPVWRPPQYWYERYFTPRRAEEWGSLFGATGLAVTAALILDSDNKDVVDRASDIGQVLNPAVALGVTVARGDWPGTLQFGLTFATAMGVTFGLKSVVEKRRPGYEGLSSYPSGHTTSAFAGACFLHTRYGPLWGIPAYVVAAFTGLARVNASRHYLDDVVAGAGIGMISAWFWTKPYRPPAPGARSRADAWAWRMEFGYGTIWQVENDISYPADVGTEIDLANIEGTDDQLSTARFTLQWRPTSRSEFLVRVDPIELRGSATLEEELRFGDTVFAPGSDLFIRWIGAEYKFRWSYELLPASRRLSLRPGATGIVAEYLVEMSTETQGVRAGSTRVIPAPHIEAAYEPIRRLEIALSADGIPGVEYVGFDAEAAIRWRVADRWDIGLLYKWSRRFVGGGIDNDPLTQGIYLTIGRAW